MPTGREALFGGEPRRRRLKRGARRCAARPPNLFLGQYLQKVEEAIDRYRTRGWSMKGRDTRPRRPTSAQFSCSWAHQSGEHGQIPRHRRSMTRSPSPSSAVGVETARGTAHRVVADSRRPAGAAATSTRKISSPLRHCGTGAHITVNRFHAALLSPTSSRSARPGSTTAWPGPPPQRVGDLLRRSRDLRGDALRRRGGPVGQRVWPDERSLSGQHSDPAREQLSSWLESPVRKVLLGTDTSN
jgi:hypothetical protein